MPPMFSITPMIMPPTMHPATSRSRPMTPAAKPFRLNHAGHGLIHAVQRGDHNANDAANDEANGNGNDHVPLHINAH